MTLKSWSIPEFTGAVPESEVSETLLDSGSGTIILLSLLVSNYSDADAATVIIERQSSVGAMKARWSLRIPENNSPIMLDSKIVFTSGDKLVVTSDAEEVSVDASGDEL